MKRVDVAIIGGSLAGAACVRELTRQGIDAIAFERDRFPREKVCGGFVSPGAVKLLDELGMLEAVHAAGATTVRSSRIHIRGREIRVELPRPGLGISRSALDNVMAAHPGVELGTVREVRREGDGFKVELEGREVTAKVVVDAAGKLSRFTRRHSVPQFGVQFYGAESHEDVLDFCFFAEGYGGTVSVEGGRTNACFLISKDALPKFLESNVVEQNEFFGSGPRPPESGGQHGRSPCEGRFPSILCEDAALEPPLALLTQEGRGFAAPTKSPQPSVPPSSLLVTGPLAYDRLPSDFIAIGDAAGMIDPFCGEGMRHALDTGICAARIIALGMRCRESYATMRALYEAHSAKRWRNKRVLGRFIRHMLQHPRITSLGLHLSPEFWFRQLWA